jgi:hypothetical protein
MVIVASQLGFYRTKFSWTTTLRYGKFCGSYILLKGWPPCASARSFLRIWAPSWRPFGQNGITETALFLPLTGAIPDKASLLGHYLHRVVDVSVALLFL